MYRKLLAATGLAGMMALNSPAMAADSEVLKDQIFSRLVQGCTSGSGMTEEECVTRIEQTRAVWQGKLDLNAEKCLSSGEVASECDGVHDRIWVRMHAVIVK